MRIIIKFIIFACILLPITVLGSSINGARLFMQYCAGCHSLKELTYTALHDLGEELQPFYRKDKDLHTKLPYKSAISWFGVVPPDLSTMADVIGKDALTRYLQGFYPDNMRKFGVNNTEKPGVMMPDVLSPLRNHPKELNIAINDIVEFLVYSSDPQACKRHNIGIYVLCFLVIFIACIFRLRRFRSEVQQSC